MDDELAVALKEAGAVLQAQMEKQSQNPLEGILEKLTPVQRASIRNALIGALVGGAGGGGLAAAAGKPVVGPALAGAGLGGLAGGGGTYGLGLLTGQEKLPGETTSPESLAGRGAEALAGIPLRHPLMTLGGILGGVGTAKTMPTAAGLEGVVREALKAKDPDAGKILDKLWGIVHNRPMAQRIREATPNVRKKVEQAIRERLQVKQKELAGLIPKGPAKSWAGKLLAVVKPSARKKVEQAIQKGLQAKQKELAGLIPKGPGLISRLTTAAKPGTRVGQMLKAIPKGFKGMPRYGRAGLALLPVGLGVGWLLDKYLKGEY